MSNQEPQTTIGVVTHVSDAVVAALPPTFLALVLLNCVFIACVLWFESHAIDQRILIMNRVLDHCIATMERRSD